MAKVRNVASTNNSDKETGQLFVVDPNPPGMETIPPEDMFIYVKFSAYPRSRTTYGGIDPASGADSFFNSGVSDEVNFISTEIKYNDNGELDPTKQKSFATTNWTDIGSQNSSGILEGFGIKSINIKYNASLVPVVDITFTDVRGSSLFDVTSTDGKDRKSPYSIFFKMPYPVFRLSIKGYFGQKVDYCLHMVNWTSNFDGTTGNFDISANFLGFQQAFLNDMVIGNIIGAVNTKNGFENLNKQDWTIDTDEGEKEISGDIRKLDDFFLKISRLQIDSEIAKADLDSFEELKKNNGILSILKEIRTFIGSPITKNDSSSTKQYLQLENQTTVFQSQQIKDNNLKINNNYLSIRDFILFKSTNVAAFETYIDTFNTIAKQYKQYLIDQNISDGDLDDKEMYKSYKQSDGKNTKENYKKFLADGFDDPVILSSVLTSMSTSGGTIPLNSNYGGSSQNDNNGKLNLTKFKELVDTNTFYKPNSFSANTNVFVIDFRQQRDLTENLIQSIEETIKEQKEKVQEELNDKIKENFKTENGFNPYIENCFRILANNTQSMVETIYEITKSAENISGRGNSIILNGLSSDIPTVITGDDASKSVAWPSIYIKNNDGSTDEVYMGATNLNTDLFPEYDFVEEVYDILVAKTKSLAQVTKASALKNGLDTDNWFPINPLDYSVNPYIRYNSFTVESILNNELISQFMTRVAILENYSCWDKDSGDPKFGTYGKLDGINAKNTIFNVKVKSIIKESITEIISNIDRLDTYEYNVFFTKNKIGPKVGQQYEIPKDQKIETGKIDIQGGRADDVDYVLFDFQSPGDYKNIINNAKKLWGDITSDDKFKKIVSGTGDNKNTRITEESIEYPIQYSYYNNNNYTNFIPYNVWFKDISSSLLSKNSNDVKTFGIKEIGDVDQTGTTRTDGYINVTNFNKSNPSNSCSYEDLLTRSNLYDSQTSTYSKAYLLLSTLPFTYFKSAIDVILSNENYNGSRILQLPKYYIYFLGSVLWRNSEELDPIDFSMFPAGGSCNYEKFNDTKDNYFSPGDVTPTPIESNLLSLPEKTKKLFISIFKLWAESTIFSDFASNVDTYKGSDVANNEAKSKAGTFIKEELNNLVNMIILAPKIFTVDGLTDGLKVTIQNLKDYIQGFETNFTESENNKDGDAKSKKQKSAEEKSEEKLAIYKYFKNINDKWVSDTDEAFNICGGSGKNLIDYFKFIDRGWRDIGNKAAFNLKSFLTLGSNLDNSVYFFTAKVLRDSNFLFQILPNYINYKNGEDVAKMFKPQTTLEDNNSSGPVFCCIYIGGTSQNLSIGERNNYYYRDDGMSFPNPNDSTDIGKNLSPDITDGNKVKDSEGIPYSLVAFRVAFGAQNQTIFKNLSLNQQEHKETGEYFKALSDLVDKRGGTQKTYKGTDLLSLFGTRSYTCKVEALGCMNIQPLTYFDLQNVPFFNGAYMITNVTHNITPNHMTTSFQGVRQSSFISPPNGKITSQLDVDLTETSEIPTIEFTNLSSKSPLYSIGVNLPDEGFDFDNFTVSNFEQIGVSKGMEESEINEFKTILSESGIVSNSQVCMFMANVFAQSDNLTNKEMPWGNGSQSKNELEIKFPSESPLSGSTRYYINSGQNDINSWKPITNASPGEDKNIAYNYPSNEDLKTDETAYSDILKSEKQINSKYLNGDITDSERIKQLQVIEKRKSDLIKTSKYYNIYPGDAYRFRPRGYLYVIGRKQYFDWFSPDGFNDPFLLSSGSSESMKTSVIVWKELKENESASGQKKKTAYDYSSKDNNDKGSSAAFTRTVEIVQQYYDADKQKSFETFEKVLKIFVDKTNKQPLIDYNKP
ncbi:MAG: hypothetical protein ACXADW_11000 [Candidatus Hodarchaeales archaeon]|jgi:hypothetical protein